MKYTDYHFDKWGQNITAHHTRFLIYVSVRTDKKISATYQQTLLAKSDRWYSLFYKRINYHTGTCSHWNLITINKRGKPETYAVVGLTSPSRRVHYACYYIILTKRFTKLTNLLKKHFFCNQSRCMSLLHIRRELSSRNRTQRQWRANREATRENRRAASYAIFY